MMFFKNNSDEAYNEAMRSMKELYDKINSNIPDWPLFDFPIVKEWVAFPEVATINGVISQKGLYINHKKYKVVKLKFSRFSEMKEHTHYGFWEYIFILSGIFEDIDGNRYKKGDNLLIDGYFPHTLKSLSGVDSEVIMIYTSDKKYANVKYIREYLSKELKSK